MITTIIMVPNNDHVNFGGWRICALQLDMFKNQLGLHPETHPSASTLALWNFLRFLALSPAGLSWFVKLLQHGYLGILASQEPVARERLLHSAILAPLQAKHL